MKFFLENKSNDAQRYKKRGQDNQIIIGLFETKKLLTFCSQVLKYYLDLFPEHYVGFIGEPNKADDEKGLVIPQRLRIYDTIISTHFLLPLYKIYRDELVAPFNMRLIRKCFSQSDDDFRTSGQFESLESFKYELSIREEEELLGISLL